MKIIGFFVSFLRTFPIDLTAFLIIDNSIEPLEELFSGTNNIRYKHIYYYALYTGTRKLSINIDKYEQFSEIGDIQWLSIPECYSKISNLIDAEVNNGSKDYDKEYIRKHVEKLTF